MSDSDDSDMSFTGLRWEDQVNNFPPRARNTRVVQAWLRIFLEQRAFDEEEIEEFIKNVHLNGEELHGLSKVRLRKRLPKTPETDGGYDLQISSYRFEQMRETTFRDIMRARKESGIIVPKVEAKKTKSNKDMGIITMALLCSALFWVLGACCIFWALFRSPGQVLNSTDDHN
ncbi:hypothetical protein PG989_004048 [Apiospora arundinis]